MARAANYMGRQIATDRGIRKSQSSFSKLATLARSNPGLLMSHIAALDEADRKNPEIQKVLRFCMTNLGIADSAEALAA